MKSASANQDFLGAARVIGAITLAFMSLSVPLPSQQSSAKKTPNTTAGTGGGARSFGTPQQAADALVNAAEQFDEAALIQILGADGEDIIFSGEIAQDRKRASDFAAEAREKQSVSVEPKGGQRAFVLVGNEEWPFPVPIVKKGEKWFFDS